MISNKEIIIEAWNTKPIKDILNKNKEVVKDKRGYAQRLLDNIRNNNTTKADILKEDKEREFLQ